MHIFTVVLMLCSGLVKFMQGMIELELSISTFLCDKVCWIFKFESGDIFISVLWWGTLCVVTSVFYISSYYNDQSQFAQIQLSNLLIKERCYCYGFCENNVHCGILFCIQIVHDQLSYIYPGFRQKINISWKRLNN